MLAQLLNVIRKDGTLQPAVLAARMDLSTAMVEAMLADLKRMGLLQRVSTACGEAPCGGCALSSSCGAHANDGQLWLIAAIKRESII